MRPYRLALARRAQLRHEFRAAGMHLVPSALTQLRLIAATIPTRNPLERKDASSAALVRRLAELAQS